MPIPPALIEKVACLVDGLVNAVARGWAMKAV
jgi:hypothetical protein